MSTEQPVRFALHRGITFSRLFHYYTSTNVDIDLTGQEIRFIMKGSDGVEVLNLSSEDSPDSNGSEVSITEPTEGRFRLLLTDETTQGFSLAEASWRIELENAGEVSRIAHGRVTITEP